MRERRPRRIADEVGRATTPPVASEVKGMEPPPWEMIEAGRYMPRRIRGSFPGRELG
jgi:hypothetical protein